MHFWKMRLHVLAKCPSCCITKNVLACDTAFLIVPDSRFECGPLQSWGLTKQRISSSSYCSSVYAWRPKPFWWPLWKCPPHSPGTLPNTRGRALHSSAAASPRPTITEHQVCERICCFCSFRQVVCGCTFWFACFLLHWFLFTCFHTCV